MKKVIIIGAGLSGCCMANLLANKGYVVDIYEQKNHIGGNCYDYVNEHGVLVHKYGPHIFHTNNKQIWDWINQFDAFNGYINQVLVDVNNQLVQFPINYHSIQQLFPDKYEIFKKEVECCFKNTNAVTISDLIKQINNQDCLDIINYLYQNIYANYTAKMWNKPISEIDISVISRVKINLNDVWNYFIDDSYQGLPIHGYTYLLQQMIKHKNIKLHLNIDAIKQLNFTNNQILFNNQPYPIIFSGCIDMLFNYCYHPLPYRSLNIQFENYDLDSYQDAAVINYPAHPTMTRICEYKKMTKQDVKNKTTISKEYPGKYDINDKLFNVPFYPINNQQNFKQYQQYLNLAKKYQNLYLIGRLAKYQYFDMDDSIAACFELIKCF